jgi:GrpB-like predicted nucleotidyltransferase (UPF0157 family)
MTTPIIIEEYDPQWPKSFEGISSRIASALGRWAAAIEHVGSTAVPGLPAKPIIDLDVLLRSDEDLLHVIQKLHLLGYQHRGTLGIPGRDAFRAPAHDMRHHLYVCSPSSQEFSRHITFRDYLRRHPRDADDYARLKRSLSGRFSIDRDAYTEAKTEFIEEILRRARLETSELFPRAKRMNN